MLQPYQRRPRGCYNRVRQEQLSRKNSHLPGRCLKLLKSNSGVLIAGDNPYKEYADLKDQQFADWKEFSG